MYINKEALKVLHLTLKKQWFDMILSGEKKEEYREIKDYWNKRFIKDYDVICFRNGCSPTSPVMVIELLEDPICRLGKKEWGAPDNAVWVLRLGEVKYQRNIK